MEPANENNFIESDENIIAERSNVNINRSYITSQSFLVGASLISMFVMNILLAMYMIDAQKSIKSTTEGSLNLIRQEMRKEKLELEKLTLSRLQTQDDLLETYISLK